MREQRWKGGQEKKGVREYINEQVTTVGNWVSVPLGVLWKVT